MKKNIALILAAALVLPTVIAAGGCGANSGVSNSAEATAENPMVLTLAHGLSETHTVHNAMTQFADEVKEKTDGRIIINIFPNGQLGSETENLEQLQAGVIAMTKVSAPGLATYNEAYNTFGLPYIFNDTEDFYDIMDSEDMQDFLPFFRGRRICDDHLLHIRRPFLLHQRQGNPCAGRFKGIKNPCTGYEVTDGYADSAWRNSGGNVLW